MLIFDGCCFMSCVFFLTLVVPASLSKPMLPERNSLVIDDFWCKYSMIGGPNG